MSPIDPTQLLTHMRSRVKGRDRILEDLAKWLPTALTHPAAGKPSASMLIIGSRSTGKRTFARALAEFLGGDPTSMIYVDGGMLHQRDDAATLGATLLKALGSEQGDAATGSGLDGPRRVVFVENIEKMHPAVGDIFVAVLRGQQVAAPTGLVINFTQCVLVFATVLGNYHFNEFHQQGLSIDAMQEAVRNRLLPENYFQPEFFDSVNRIYPFPLHDVKSEAEIALLKLAAFAQTFELSLRHVAPEALVKLMASAPQYIGVGHLDRLIYDRFSGSLAEASQRGARSVNVLVDRDGNVIAVPVEA